MKEKDIMFERGDYWVSRERDGYAVNRTGPCASVEVARFGRDVDGLSCAIAYAAYRSGDRMTGRDAMMAALCALALEANDTQESEGVKEEMCRGREELERGNKHYRASVKDHRDQIGLLRRQNVALRGVITKLRKKS